MAGKPVHVEIAASDAASAVKFYGDLFGWQFQQFEGSPAEYHMAQASEETGAAITASGDAPPVRVYYDVDDVRAARSRVEELGGKADEPMPVPGMGWFATCTDPEGGPFGLWQHDPGARMP